MDIEFPPTTSARNYVSPCQYIFNKPYVHLYIYTCGCSIFL